MATFNYFVSGKMRKLVPIYLRLSAGKGVDLIVKSGQTVDPKRWSNDTQTIKQRIRTEDDELLIKNLKGLKDHAEREFKAYFGEYSKEWFNSVIDKFYNKKSEDAKNLNDFIEQFIKEAESGDRKSKSKKYYAPGTIYTFKGFQMIFNEYQGIYTDKRLKQIERENKKRAKENKSLRVLRSVRKLDFEDITVDFYNSFIKFIQDEGYAQNTLGRHIRILKILMKKSLKLHHNREFQEETFSGISEEAVSIALTPDELNKMYNIDLSGSTDKWLEPARDAWFFMYETLLRISDYDKINVNLTTLEGKRVISIFMQKTDKKVTVPLTARFLELWEKYHHQVPPVHNQTINHKIKIVARMAGIDRVVTWKAVKYGKSYLQTAKAWQKISCHTARRSGATVLRREKMDIDDIRVLLGHRNRKTTELYLKLTNEEQVLKIMEHDHYKNNLTVVKAG